MVANSSEVRSKQHQCENICTQHGCLLEPSLVASQLAPSRASGLDDHQFIAAYSIAFRVQILRPQAETGLVGNATNERPPYRALAVMNGQMGNLRRWPACFRTI